ncbi:TKL protein kinase [Phytophthora cinnamomi]|uniref:TKL protein kinase n=1 Tax=Phytophthora cinnamomi TaxID=4785 RepID=UPI00355A8C3E|nr:TKL protein kinase [Phytophthora cinnamomi]
MTSRHRGVLRFLAGFVGVTVICTGVVAAQSNGNGPGVLRTNIADTSSSASNSSSDDETAAYIARGYATTMAEDEQRLTIMTNSLLTESVCDGEPMVILKSATVPANGACLAAQSRYNLSCSCLSGYANTTTWSFRVGVPDTEPTSPFPTTINQGNIVQVDSLMMLDVPADLLVFKIQGESSNFVPVNLEKSNTGDDVVAIVRSQEVSALTKVDVFNLDLFGVPIGDGFVPTTLSTLLMRRCNLSSLSQSFLESFTGLESLNLAANKLSSIYTDLPGSAEALNAMIDM